MKQFIYADNAATTKLDIDAFEEMKPYLLEDYANASQPYFFSLKAKRALKEARETIASCIGAKPEEIYFTSGGTESDNWAIKSFGLPSDVRVVLTSEIEHHAVLNACKDAVRLSVDTNGIVPLNELEAAFDLVEYPASSNLSTLVSVMLVNNEIGTIEPIKELAAIAHQHGAYFHTDAVQAVGHIPIDVDDLGVDMLSASAHKFNGPKGVGFLYIREGTRIHSLLDGGAQERQIRAGTENVAGVVGMAVALKKNCDMICHTEAKLKKLEKALLATLKQAGVDYIRNGAEYHVPGNINISIRGAKGEMLLHRLDLMGICISTGSACDSVDTQVSHVIKAVGVPKEYADGTIRISFGRDNTEAEAEKIAEAIVKILSVNRV